MSMITDVMDACRCPTMSWMYVDAHQCSRCMATLSDILDVWWCSQMSWMYVDAYRWHGCILPSWFIAQNFYSRCTLMSFDSYLLICHEKKTFLTTRNPLIFWSHFIKHQNESIQLPLKHWNKTWKWKKTSYKVRKISHFRHERFPIWFVFAL